MIFNLIFCSNYIMKNMEKSYHKYVHDYFIYNCKNGRRKINATWEIVEVNYTYQNERLLCIHSK